MMTRRAFCALVLCALIAGCAGMQARNVPVEVRAQQRWDALLAQDYETAYEFLSPGYRSTVSLENYKLAVLARTVKWTGAEVVRPMDCDENRCTMLMKIDYMYRSRLPGVGAYGMAQGAEEQWIKLDGVWYFVPDAIR